MAAKNAVNVKSGDRYGRLTVIREVAKQSDGRRAFELKCDCGEVRIIKLIALRCCRPTQSCGCMRTEVLDNRKTHGRSRTPMYVIWSTMRRRCENRNDKSFVNYGGRGIKVCDRWKTFENFLADMGERPSDRHEIDRIDNEKGYEPGNVRWLDDGHIQTVNRRPQKGGTSRYRGVDWWNNRAWRARITIRGKIQDLGLFDNEEDAALAYDAVARCNPPYHLNFPNGENP